MDTWTAEDPATATEREATLRELTGRVVLASPRTAAMVIMRLEKQMTLKELAEHFNISRQAVSQAFAKLETELLDAMPELAYHARHGNRMRNPRFQTRKEYDDKGRQARTARQLRDAATIANRLTNAPKRNW